MKKPIHYFASSSESTGRHLQWGLRHRLLAVSAPVLLLAGVLLLVPKLGTEFIPIMDEGAFDMDVQFLPGMVSSFSQPIQCRIGATPISTPAGYRVPLAALAAIYQVEGPVQISRENGQRRISIEVNVVNRDIGSFVEETRSRIRESVSLPPAYYLSWGGQFENQQRAMTRLMVIAPLTVLLIFALLYLTFGSLKMAGLVMLNLLFARGPGSEIQRPLATVVVGGLFTSTFLTLLLLPIVLSWAGRKK